MLVLNILYIYQSHNTACKAGVVHPAGRHAAFGYEDGSIRIYDLQSQQVIHSFTKGLKILLLVLYTICNLNKLYIWLLTVKNYCYFIVSFMGSVQWYFFTKGNLHKSKTKKN